MSLRANKSECSAEKAASIFQRSKCYETQCTSMQVNNNSLGVKNFTASLPMSGIVEDAGGVLSASNINRMKNATNTFIPGHFTDTSSK